MKSNLLLLTLGAVVFCGEPQLETTDVSSLATLDGLDLACHQVLASGCPGHWIGEYFYGRDLSGQASAVLNATVIDFDWQSSGPQIGGVVTADDFSARWTKTLYLPQGRYEFLATADDGVRVWVDQTLLIDQWRDQPATTYLAETRLDAGVHTVRIEYYEKGGLAAIQFRAGLMGTSLPPQNWSGEYFNGTDLHGPVIAGGSYVDLDLSWGSNSPVPGWVPTDLFSARFSKTYYALPAGPYWFRTVSDDGVRVFVDGEPVPVIEYWNAASAIPLSALRYLNAGDHSVVVEYMELWGDAQIEFDLEPAHTSTTTHCGHNEWAASYYQGSVPNQGAGITVCEGPFAQGPSFDWGWSAPVGRAVAEDHFRISWSRTVDFAPGYYRFTAAGDDRVEVRVDDVVVAQSSSAGSVQGGAVFLRGPHPVVVNYVEETGDAWVDVSWQRSCGGESVVIGCTAPPSSDPYQSSWVDLVDPTTGSIIATRGPDLAGQVVQRVGVDVCNHPDGRNLQARQYVHGTYQGFVSFVAHAGENVTLQGMNFSDRPGSVWTCE